MIVHQVPAGSAIDRWLLAGIYERRVRYDPVPIENCDQYLRWWVTPDAPLYENPARRRFVAERRGVSIELVDVGRATAGMALDYWDQHRSWEYYAPFGHPWVDHSGFWAQPTHLAEWAVTTLLARARHQAVFRLRTAGRVKVWVNGVPVADFSPFTRNEPQGTSFVADLVEGANLLAIYHEDLAERDTRFDFRLDYVDGVGLRTALPTGDARAVDLRKVEAALADAHFDTDVSTSGALVVRIVNTLPRTLAGEVRWWRQWGSEHTRRYQLPPGSDRLVLGPVKAFGDGVMVFDIGLQVGGFWLRRRLVQQIYPDGTRPDAPMDSSARRQYVLDLLVRSGVDNLQKAHAILRRGGNRDAAAAIVRAEARRIQTRQDCSDFSLVPAFRLWAEYRRRNVLPEAVWSDLEAAILSYRYWCDEPGDDVMWFFSENHALLFHAAELLAGQLFPNELFPNDGVRGEVHYARAKQRLEAWLARFWRGGLAEWNSNAYLPIVCMGLLAVADLARERTLRRAARNALDALFERIVAGSTDGVLATTQGRTYELELKGDRCNAVSCMNWIAFGNGYPNSAPHGSADLALSTYEPSAAVGQLERLLRAQRAIYRVHHGPPGHADVYTYRTGRSLLASAIHYRPGGRGYQEHVVHATLGAGANVWINHPGELKVSGPGRPSYWAGNGVLPDVVQFQGLAVVTFAIPVAEEIGFTHAYFPEALFEEVAAIGGRWRCARRGNSFIGVYAHNGLRAVERGPNRRRELRSPGRRNVWLLRLGDSLEFGDFAQFCGSMGEVRVLMRRDLVVEVKEPVYGRLRLHWNGPAYVGRRRVVGIGGGYPVRGVWQFVER
jgi:hypothetical protein